MCFPGSFSSWPNATQCELCPQHTFNNIVDAVTCYRCPYGSYTPDLGATACTPCTEGNLTYLAIDTLACAMNTPSYSNVIQAGVGMLLIFVCFVLLARYYAARKRIQIITLKTELRRRAHNLVEPYDGILTKSPDAEDMHSDDGDLFPPSLQQQQPPPPLPTLTPRRLTTNDNNNALPQDSVLDLR